MAKRIVVCSDGTGNTAIKGRGTNVFKVFEAVDLNGHRLDTSLTPQVAIYDDGVGTEDFKPLKLLGGAFGWGLSRNVKHLYGELARIYDPGDEIYMFGFSRGAFTVRTLAGFIAACGLVDPNKIDPKTFGNLKKEVDRAYKAYRKCYRPRLWQLFGKPTRDAARNFKAQHSVLSDVRIRFLGVWDTVDAVGLPFHLGDVWNATVYRFKFPDHDLTSIVDGACQALSVDDPRRTFYPQLWNENGQDAKRITQVWFAGVHSNIGGGYPKQGMSLVALDFMLAEAERAGEPFNQQGLRVNQTERDYFRDHASVDDKLYDPRANLGIFYRWKIRDIAALCRNHNVQPKVHQTALERIAHGSDDYAPGNLPGNSEVVITRPTKGEDVDLALRRAAALQKVLATIPDETLLNGVRAPIRIGVAAYYVYMAFCVAVLLAASGLSPQSLSTHPWMALATAGKLIWALITNLIPTVTQIAVQIVRNPALALFLGAGFATSYLMMFIANQRMDAVFSGFWYPRQTALRDGLKQARKDAIASGH
jgi:uncharacterized protein (DUF2235 family)